MSSSFERTDPLLAATAAPSRPARPTLPRKAEGPRTVVRSINGEDWEKLSAEAKIKWINEDEKWGWVVYRCSYAKELEPAWDRTKRRIVEGLRQEIAESDTPSIANTMDFIFIEDPSLEGASIEQLQHRFQAWARANCDWDFPEGDLPEISRFQFFLKADAELLRRDDLVLVHGWRHDPEEEEQENWIKIAGDAVSTNLYISFDNPELWFMYYTLPGSYANVY